MFYIVYGDNHSKMHYIICVNKVMCNPSNTFHYYLEVMRLIYYKIILVCINLHIQMHSNK